MMKWIGCWLLLAAFISGGCTTQSKANARARAAFFAGQQQAASHQVQGPSVWMAGNVRNPIIPWTADLTLAKALAATEYLGSGDPSQITVLRNRRPYNFSSKQLLQGQDMPLEAGDRVEIRP